MVEGIQVCTIRSAHLIVTARNFKIYPALLQRPDKNDISAETPSIAYFV